MRFFIIMAMVIGWSGSIAQSACGQPFEVQLSIDSVNFFDNGNIITVSLKCKNFSNKNLLLYGFESDLNRYTDLARICNLDRVAPDSHYLFMTRPAPFSTQSGVFLTV